MKQEYIITHRKPGRPKVDLARLTYAYRLYTDTTLSMKEICNKAEVSRTSIYRYIQQQQKKGS